MTEKEKKTLDFGEDNEIKDSHVITKEGKTIRFKALLNSAFAMAITLSVAALTISILTESRNDPANTYFEKSIKADILTVIQNDADINVIKNLYQYREIKNYGLFSVFKKKADNIYALNTPLSRILDDIQIDLYKSPELDSCLLQKVNHVIEIHNQLNPFDKLDNSQKHNFENIQLKLNSKFSLIQNDVTKIADELHNKNLLVEKYLDKSTTSYWISIIALVATILLSIYQLYQNRKSKQIRTIFEAIDEYASNSDDDDSIEDDDKNNDK